MIEKMRRVCQVHHSAAIANIACRRLGVSTAVTASAITSGGIASATSVRRMIKISIQPPKYPARSPSVAPTGTANPKTTAASSSEIR